MGSDQHKIGSGFDECSTATEVLAGMDLSGKLAVVTGGYSGIGLETARALCAAGADVSVPARRVAYAQQILRPLGAEVCEADLTDQTSIQATAASFLEKGRSIDILINNAAIMAIPETRVGPGWEIQLAANHLGHYTLTNLLWPALTANGGARVVSVTSNGHKWSPLRFDDPQFAHGYDKWAAYGQAKTANVLFAVELDELGKDSEVRAFAAHPGGVMTELQRYVSESEMIAMGWIDKNGNSAGRYKSPEQGAATSVWAATSPMLDGVGGVYCEDCDVAEPTEVASPDAGLHGVDEYAIDLENARRLWALSAELTGVNAFA